MLIQTRSNREIRSEVIQNLSFKIANCSAIPQKSPEKNHKALAYELVRKSKRFSELALNFLLQGFRKKL